MATIVAAVVLVIAIPAFFRIGEVLGKSVSFKSKLQRLHLL